MDKPMTFNEWMGKQGNLALVHANCCRIAYEAGQQSQQAKVEELQTLYTQQGINMLKLQKRVDAALKETQFALQYVEEDMRGNHEFLQMAMIRTFKALEQALKGEG
ncbi:TPA: hypothetical protein ACSIQO_002966 [Acinetobacter baumannii]|uniref:hypothetical protein n=1 Tax=Acinetobacter baumannii TaxID=470 RepID=UPI00396B03B4